MELECITRPKVQIHRDKKNTKPEEVEIYFQGHQMLMYGIRMHVGPGSANS
jgi:hypothetical protein